MSLSVKFVKDKKSTKVHMVVPVFEKQDLLADIIGEDVANSAAHALAVNEDFKGGIGEILDIVLPSGAPAPRLIVLGLGASKDFALLKAEEAGGKLSAYLSGKGIERVALFAEASSLPEGQNVEDVASALAFGATMRCYNFDRYKSKSKDSKKDKGFTALDIVCEHTANVKAVFEAYAHISEGVFQARDLVNMPPNDLYPEAYAKLIKDELKPLGVEVEVLDEKKMLKAGMGAIMAVGQGSERLPRMVLMRWKGSKKNASKAPLAFVGKGVTFDTGGISIKPSAGMDEMKMDMGGSAAVVGLMKTLALRQSDAHVVAVVGLAENMPSSKAYRPGDIIKAYNGKTVEVLNTDAEGRLVLADCLTYIQERYSPELVIDLATLTGAIMVALGHEYCGTFVNDDDLWSQMDAASKRSGEKLWRMPLDEAFEKQVESNVADLQNIGKDGRWGGACTAAAFLQQFIEKDTSWAHMDIAGTAYRKSDRPTIPKFGSGFGVRVLNDLIMSDYEG